MLRAMRLRAAVARIEQFEREDHRTLLIRAAAVFALLAFVGRLPFFYYDSWDYHTYIGPWFRTLDRDGLSALGTDFSNYTSPYLILLWLGTLTGLPELLTIKLISVAFDFALAGGCALLIRSVGGSGLRTLAAFTLVAFSPTVTSNSAVWGQSDAIYAACMVFGIVFLVRCQPPWAMLAFGMSLAVKPQGVFILPFLLVLLLRGRLPLRWLVLLPAPYLLALLPPVLYGRPLGEALSVYQDQAENFPELAKNAPTVYALLPLGEGFAPVGIAIAAIIVLGVVSACVRRARLEPPEEIIAMAAFFLVLVPFVLPLMHERYFFAADAVTIVYAVLRPRRWFVPVLVGLASFFSYFPFLTAHQVVPLELSAGMMAAALLTLAYDVLWRREAEAAESDTPGAGTSYEPAAAPVS